MSSDAKSCVSFSVIELEPLKHVIKLGMSGWFRRIYCLRDNCGVTERVSTSEHVTPSGSVCVCFHSNYSEIV